MTLPEQGDASAGRAYVGVEVGDLAAWISITCGETGPKSRWRASFTAPPTPDAFLTRVADGVRDLCGGHPIAGVGIASWPQVDSERGALKAGSSMLEWDDFPLTARLGEILAAPCRVGPAINAAALAEATLGTGKGESPVVYIHLGREILCSLVYNGAPLTGAHGQIGQLGHWSVTDHGPRCACGAIGHLNPLCSSQGIVRLAIGLASQDESALAQVNRVTGGRAESLTASGVVALASAGVEPLRDLASQAAEALGRALAQLSLVVNPALIILGGPLGVAGGYFLEQTRERLAGELHAIPSAGAEPRLAPAALDPHSALAGAWLLAREPVPA